MKLNRFSFLAAAALAACGLPDQAEQQSLDAQAIASKTDTRVAVSRADELAGLDSTGSKVIITGTSGADTATVRYYPNDTSVIVVTLNGAATTYMLNPLFGNAITQVVFYGNAGNDNFSNTTSLPTTAYGHDGDDVLSGGSGPDFLEGDYGNDMISGNGGADRLWGSGGNDILYGGTGNDELYGHSGIDWLFGEDGNDTLNGGSGNDQYSGGYGNDTIVAVGLGVDTISGNAQWDYFWVDADDAILDVSTNEENLGFVHVIDEFMGVSYDGGDSALAVGLDPLGEDLPDPNPKVADASLGLIRWDFSDRVLFRASGPNKEDIFQGGTGDCYFMSSLAAIANSDQDYIRNMVVALGDGTYAVRFYRDGDPYFVRVDGDLYVDPTDNYTLRYAKLGSTNALWVPIVEKAYAIFRREQGNYDSVANGDGTLEIGTSGGGHLNLYKTTWLYPDLYTKEQVLTWIGQGQPSGAIRTTRNNSVNAFLVWVQQQRAAGAALMAGSMPDVSNTSALTADYWRRGKHVYMIDRVTVDLNNTPNGIVLRNPYGGEVTITDYTHIWFSIGGAARWDLP